MLHHATYFLRDVLYGLMTYANKRQQRLNVPIDLRIPKKLFLKKLAKARFLSGVTATGAALRAVAALQFLRKTDIIVVTDGFTFDTVGVEAQKLRKLPNIRVLVVGNYSPVVKKVLDDIAGDSNNVLLGNQSVQRLLNLLKC
ncbi:hypothetical protein DICVIV_12117 [Dictyocaulus viviparus]|uniref:VWFA domain-containing protein n=1 Tax=Dictyocaulus viviparus TaxID=29172 RepID=A0A0D8XDQ5_DICVI|nr:hypothetical protein DICVIV_12117 [Dictyocaulus viviparus]